MSAQSSAPRTSDLDERKIKRSVIFDLDGTLVETEQIWRDVRHDYVLEHGGRWQAGAQNAMIGMRTAEWAHYLRDTLGVALPESEIAKQVVERVVKRLSHDIPVLPDAGQALERLASEFPLGLATSATRVVAETVLTKTGWKRYFNVVISADEVARGKPAPDIYLRAIELLKADPRVTVAIEDSANGIRSAHAAHIAVIAIPNREFIPDANALSLATRVIPTLENLDAETIRDALSFQ